MRLGYLHIIFMVLLLTGCKKSTDWSFTLDKNSTEPYGLFLAHDRLLDMFPGSKKSTIYDLMKEINRQNSKTYFTARNSLLISVTANLYLNEEEAKGIYDYVRLGGRVILLSRYFSDEIDSVFQIKSRHKNVILPFSNSSDSINQYGILWDEDIQKFELDKSFSQAYFTHQEGEAIGYRVQEDKRKVNLIKRDIGDGSILMGNAPEMLTNYALLKDDNVQYYEKLFSYFDKNIYELIWFSKHTVFPKRSRGDHSSNLMNLLKQKPYFYAFMTLLFMAMLFFIFETKRKQRIVEVIPPVTNDSLAFTEIIGKLYHSKKNHGNLAQKMIRYYLEHIRTTYNISTTHLNNEFVHKLSRKLNQPQEAVQQFVDYLNSQLMAEQLNEEQLKQLYLILKKYS